MPVDEGQPFGAFVAQVGGGRFNFDIGGPRWPQTNRSEPSAPQNGQGVSQVTPTADFDVQQPQLPASAVVQGSRGAPHLPKVMYRLLIIMAIPQSTPRRSKMTATCAQ
jgi:hypothetical protein